MRFCVLKSVYEEISKSLESQKLDYFKKELIKILDRQNSFEKAYGIGKLSTYTDGSVWRKVSSNPAKWKMVRGPKDYNAESQGMRIAVGKIKKQIQSSNSYSELLSIVIANKKRFIDNEGRYLPIVKELMAEIKKTHSSMKRNGVNVLSEDDKKFLKDFTDKVEKNEKGQFIYDNFSDLSSKQKKYVISDLLNRDYTEVKDGIFVESNREQDVGEKVYAKEFKDCEVLKQIGFDKLYMLPQQYAVRTNKQTANNTDTFAFRNGQKFDFIELKNPDNPNLKNLQEAYEDSVKQANNVFIVCNQDATDDEYWRAINGRMKLIIKKAEEEGKRKPDLAGNVFIYNEKKNEVVLVNINKYALEIFSRAGLESSQNLSKWGTFQVFHLSNNIIPPSSDSVKQKNNINKSFREVVNFYLNRKGA